VVKELSAEQVRKRCGPSVFGCNSTGELEPMEGIIGQDRALSALRFGLNVAEAGFNIFVSGPAGTGRTTAIKSFLEALANEKGTPPDWCYVHNFHDAYCPRALKLPAGTGRNLQRDMKSLIADTQLSITRAFASKEYADQRTEITDGFNQKRETMFSELREKAEDRGFLMQSTPVGLVFAPTSKGEPMSEEEYQKLSSEDKEELKRKREELTRELKGQITRLRSEENTVRKQLEDADREVVRYSISHLFEELRNNYSQLPQVADYLSEVKQDIIENSEQFKSEPKAPDAEPLSAVQGPAGRQQSFRKYDVNILVDNSELKGAPVILELNPTFSNLLGRIEKESQFGALYTDFTMIKSGSLHRATGGYLVVRVEDLLAIFQSWEGLKRTLRDGKLVIEEIGERLGFILTSGALAKIIEHSSRLAGNQEKLSTLFADIADIIREAGFWAGEAGASLIEAGHLEKAIEQRVYRSNLIQQRINEMIDKGMIMIDTEEEKVGQLNGLEVLDLGDFSFGKPARITASVGVGREGLIDIERESKLGGRLHSKGVMILNGYITEKYARDVPLSLSARLVFEQSYEEIEGDSASSAELYTLLSSLSGLPIKQSIAVTGSVNQRGEVQAIGGLNEKIEGFFEVCKARGLRGKEGVVIPQSNIRNLMLKEEVAEAVKAGKFHIYPVATIDEGIEVLTGRKMGQRLADGSFEPDSVNDRVQRRLTALAERLRDFTKGEEKDRSVNDKV
jgi:predicted ATP-dependent protease